MGQGQAEVSAHAVLVNLERLAERPPGVLPALHAQINLADLTLQIGQPPHRLFGPEQAGQR